MPRIRHSFRSLSLLRFDPLMSCDIIESETSSLAASSAFVNPLLAIAILMSLDPWLCALAVSFVVMVNCRKR